MFFTSVLVHTYHNFSIGQHLFTHTTALKSDVTDVHVRRSTSSSTLFLFENPLSPDINSLGYAMVPILEGDVSKVKCSRIPTLKKALAMAWSDLDEGGVQCRDRKTRTPDTSPLLYRKNVVHMDKLEVRNMCAKNHNFIIF